MNYVRNRKLSRRDFLKLTGTGLAAAGLGPLAAGCTPRTPALTSETGIGNLPTGQKLNWWWWGEQEGPGLEAWIKESAKIYQEKSGNLLTPTLMDTDVVVSQFQTASAANDAPDVVFLWNGSYCMESVWLGYVEPLNELIPENIRTASQPTILSSFQDKPYRLGFYALSALWSYGKEVFDKSGLNADEPPKTWDDFLNACDKIKSAGYIPISGGLRDGFWGGWWLSQTLVHDLDTAGDALDLFIGELDWREAKYVDHWAKLKQLQEAGFLNDDMLSNDLYPGIEIFMAGNSGFTATVSTLVPESMRLLGNDKVGLMILPYGGQGKFAGLKPIADTQGWGISSQSENKEVAADFLMFLQSDERLNAMWEGPKQFPANFNWDGKQAIEDPTLKQLWAEWINTDFLPWIEVLMPVMFWSEAMFVNAQKIVSGEWTPEQCAENSYQITQKWYKQNPDMVEKYQIWKKGLSL
jgi:raffinose/stachyose/melibiose transport system substrate-binding protein